MYDKEALSMKLTAMKRLQSKYAGLASEATEQANIIKSIDGASKEALNYARIGESSEKKLYSLRDKIKSKVSKRYKKIYKTEPTMLGKLTRLIQGKK